MEEWIQESVLDMHAAMMVAQKRAPTAGCRKYDLRHREQRIGARQQHSGKQPSRNGKETCREYQQPSHDAHPRSVLRRSHRCASLQPRLTYMNMSGAAT